jgi:uncharacterized protein (DUF983 family)
VNDFINGIKTAFRCKCPKCHQGTLYQSRFDLRLNDKCPECGFDLEKNDSADGPAVFLIFILGALIVPLALFVDAIFIIPLWLHAVIWSVLVLLLTVGSLKPLKSYIIMLQYKYRKSDWDKE